MTGRDYRDDDRNDLGYCPKCGTQLANLTAGLRGYCEQHGWTFAEWTGREPDGYRVEAGHIVPTNR